MWTIIKEYRHYVATLILAVIPLIALNTGGRSPTELHWFDRAALALSEPAQNAIRWGMEVSWDGIENYFLLLHTKVDNQDLSLENRKLLHEIAELQETARENERLRKIVDFNAPIEGKKIVAQVIAQDVSSEFRMIRINKGSEQGVEAGMAAVSLEGIVGRIIRVGKKYADILTILDSSSAIDAVLQRNRVRGVIEGLGENLLSMKYLRRTDDVVEGDLIVSSGIGGLFPKGLLLGKVVSVKKKTYGISQAVEVSPSVDFNKLEDVTVISPPAVPLEEAHLETPDRDKRAERAERKLERDKEKKEKAKDREKDKEKEKEREKEKEKKTSEKQQ